MSHSYIHAVFLAVYYKAAILQGLLREQSLSFSVVVTAHSKRLFYFIISAPVIWLRYEPCDECQILTAREIVDLPSD